MRSASRRHASHRSPAPEMYRIDPGRLDLAREFKRRPLGIHSAELQALLTHMRSRENCGDFVLVCTKPHEEWVLAVKQPDGAPPRLLEDERFASIEAAEWRVFEIRWERLSGQKLVLEEGKAEVSRRASPASGPGAIGYIDKQSIAPGETAVFRISVLGGRSRYRAQLVRLICADTGPKGPGLREEPVTSPLDGEHEGFEQATDCGSYAIRHLLEPLVLAVERTRDPLLLEPGPFRPRVGADEPHELRAVARASAEHADAEDGGLAGRDALLVDIADRAGSRRREGVP